MIETRTFIKNNVKTRGNSFKETDTNAYNTLRWMAFNRGYKILNR